jgi:hypothetical protein
VSDSIDPEWGTSGNVADIEAALKYMHDKLGSVIGGPPAYILDVVHREELGPPITATFTEQQWRILRFACERAMENL